MPPTQANIHYPKVEVRRQYVYDPNTLSWVAAQQASGGGGGSVTVSNFPSSQAVTGPITDTQLRASAVPVSLSSIPALAAGSNVIGHIVADSGSTTAVTGNVTVIQPTGSNLHVQVDSAPSTPVTNANLDVALSTRTKPSDQQHAIIDSGTTTVTQATGSNLHVVVDTAPTTTVTGTVTTSPPSNASTNLTQISGSTLTIGQQLAAASIPVILPSATITTLTPPAAITGFALEAGHLATIDSHIPALGQALAAASVPVILPSATITTLTPPAAITGFALEAGHLATIDSHIPALGQALAAASIPVILPSATVTTLTPPTNTGYALDSSLSTLDTDLKSNITLHAGTNVIGHVITDTNSVTNATLSAETTKVIGTVNISSGQTVGLVAGSQVIGHVVVDTAPTTAVTNSSLDGTTLASIKTDLDKIPSLGQALAASSVPVVLTAIQQTALTPPTNTGYALDASLSTIDTDLKASQPRKLQDGSGNAITSTSSALDVNLKTSAITVPISDTNLDTNLDSKVSLLSTRQIDALLLTEIRLLRQAFQDWSGAVPRYDDQVYPV